MKKNTSNLASVIKKPGSYVVDMDELKSNIQGKDIKITEQLESSRTNERKSVISKKQNINKEEVETKTVGLHVPIPINLRDKLKIKAISEGKRMRDFIVELIEKNVD